MSGSTIDVEEDNDDPFAVFDDDDDDDNDTEGGDGPPILQEAVTFLKQQFIASNPQISKRFLITSNPQWHDYLTATNSFFHLLDEKNEDDWYVDAIIVHDMNLNDSSVLRRRIVPCGWLLLVTPVESSLETLSSALHPAVWNINDSKTIIDDHQNQQQLRAVQKWGCPINSLSCKWKPHRQNNLYNELCMLQKATITRSAQELQQKHSMGRKLAPNATSQAVDSLNKYGYCVIRSLLEPSTCIAWGKAALDDLHAASQILLKERNVNLYDPGINNSNEPQSYRELSMREDLRMDLREGPRLKQMREQEQRSCNIDAVDDDDNCVIITSSMKGSTSSCMRFNPDILEIVKRTFNPVSKELHRGNFGRYNFSGSGPDGSPQNIRISKQGAIISLPGSADQAIHADTPHLFEIFDCLPSHYINTFCLGTADIPYDVDEDSVSTGSTTAGGTAFVHASHKLSFTASLQDDWSVTSEPKVLQNLVRPSLELGDVLLFDCRILHFGLSNTSTVERPMLYTNITQSWFQDPKNWDNREAIFPSTSYS